MSAVLIIGLVGSAIVLLLWWALGTRRPLPPSRAHDDAPPACPVQMLFVAQTATDQLLADGVLLDAAWSDAGLVPPGTPVTLRIRLPRDEVIARSMAGVLRGWAEEDAEVDARFTDEGGVVRAQLGRDRIRLLVDLEDVVVVPRPAA